MAKKGAARCCICELRPDAYARMWCYGIHISNGYTRTPVKHMYICDSCHTALGWRGGAAPVARAFIEKCKERRGRGEHGDG